MSDVLIILCTFPEAEQARQIGTALVKRQLAACVNLIPAIESIYRWQGKVENSREVFAIFKTTNDVFPDFETALIELHPYDVPEIIAITADQISKNYHAWLINNVALLDQ